MEKSVEPTEDRPDQSIEQQSQPVPILNAGLLVVPDAVGGIQINFCKNPSCPNFSTPAEGIRKNPGRSKNTPPTSTEDQTVKPVRYKTGRAGNIPYIQCQSCNECPPIKSNLGIKEELDRLTAPLDQKETLPCCPNEDCDNHKNMVPASNLDAYWQNGYTSIRSPRWKCRLCLKTFSQAQKSTHRQRKSSENISIFRNLMNKVPLRSISRIANMSPKAIYDKIDFIYRQCVAFAAHRERDLPNLKKKWMEISVDRQEHTINWFQKGNKKNIKLHAIASVDNRTGYVFASHLNYEPSLNLRQVEADLHTTQDHKLLPPFRKYARLWLRADHLATTFDETVGNTTINGNKSRQARIDELVDAVYRQAAERPDIEAYDELDIYSRLPEWGMQVHAEYTLYAHFFFLLRQLSGIGYVCFYMDQDSGIRAACLGAFADRVLDKSCDAFYVKVGKELTQAHKLALVNKWQWTRDEFVAKNGEYEDVPDNFIRRCIVRGLLDSMTPHGKWGDLWLEHPFATMSEPEKMVCYLTNIKNDMFDHSKDNMAMKYDRASLHYVDSFFMQSRRRISLFERAISSSSSAYRKWHGYNAYRPIMVAKLMEIFRVYHNYVIETEGIKRRRLKEGEKKRKKGTVVKKSPAVRLGLAKGSVTEADILYFMPSRD